MVEILETKCMLAGTPQLLADINPGVFSSAPHEFATLGTTTLFSANDGSSGSELWKTDGTNGGTEMVKDINPGADDSLPGHLSHYFTNVNGTLFFTADDGSSGFELWKTDGTTAGTMLVMDINAGSDNSYPRNLVNVNGTLYFQADNGSAGNELWRGPGIVGQLDP